jgi:hypothetical protein
MRMMNQVMGGVSGAGMGMVQQPPPGQPVYPQPAAPMTAATVMTPPPVAGGAVCTCGQPITGKFCAGCGAAASVPAAPTGCFCTECGLKRALECFAPNAEHRWGKA